MSDRKLGHPLENTGSQSQPEFYPPSRAASFIGSAAILSCFPAVGFENHSARLADRVCQPSVHWQVVLGVGSSYPSQANWKY